MFKHLKNKKAQAISGEYLLVIFLVVGMGTAMIVYVSRGLQGRYYDTRNAMVKSVQDGAEGQYVGKVLTEYEPYYANTDATVTRDILSEVSLSEGTRKNSAGIFKKEINEETSVWAISETRPPKDAN